MYIIIFAFLLIQKYFQNSDFNQDQIIKISYKENNKKKIVPYLNLYFEEKSNCQVFPFFLDFNSDNSLIIGKTNINNGFKCQDEDFCKFNYYPLLEDSYDDKDYFYYEGKTSLKLKSNFTECVTKMDFRYVMLKNFNYEEMGILGFSPKSDFYNYNLKKNNNNNILFIYNKLKENNNSQKTNIPETLKFNFKLNQSMESLKCMGNEINKYPLIQNENNNLYMIEGNIKSVLFKEEDFKEDKKYKFCIFFDKDFIFYFSKNTKDICKEALRWSCYKNCDKKEEINFFITPDIKLNFNGIEYLVQARHYLKFNKKWDCDLGLLENKYEKDCDFGIGQKFFYLYNPILGFDDIKNPYIMFLKFYKENCYRSSLRFIMILQTVLLLILIILGVIQCKKNFTEKKKKKENDKIYKLHVN